MGRKLILAVLLLFGFAQYAGSRAADFTIAAGYPKPIIVTPTSLKVEILVESVSGEFGTFVLEQTPTCRIFDITGKEVGVKTVTVEDTDSMSDYGYTNFIWTPGNNIPSGVYIYRIESSSHYIYCGTIVVAK